MVARKLLVFANGNNEINNEETRPRKRTRRHRVRFSEEKPRVKVYEDFPADLTPPELQQAYQRVWYTTEESDALLQDRLHTIRLWRALGGNPRLMEPLYCLRGLEMYESAGRNADFLAARTAAVQAVLEEQARQKQENPGAPLDWDQVHRKVAARSAMSARHASQLAWKDALEAQDAFEPSTAPRMTSHLPKRLSMPFSAEVLPNNSTSGRLSLSSGTLFGTTRAPVDIHKLKEMNRQFLQSMTTVGGAAGTLKSNDPTPPRLLQSNSLSLLLVRGRRLQAEQEQAQEPVSSQANATFSLRDSLHELLNQV